MSDVSPLLALPLIQPAQAQKHITHNSAIDRLDMLVQVVVEAFEATTPPGAPLEGQIWALGALPLGAWAGQPQTLASWRNGAWVFIAPAAGWRAWGRSEARLRIFAAGVWGPLLGDGDLQNLTGVGINAASDATNRLTVSAPASLFSHQGAGHQVKVNKATPGDTASLLFQSGWSGRAEIGLAGSDDLAVKVSADGSLFQTGLSVAAASGVVTAPAGLRVAAGSAAAPGLSFDGDPDTGLLRPAANQIGLATAGVQRAVLSATALQVDVPLTGTAVQSSATDSTDGRALRMTGGRGPFGLGSNLGPPITDFTAEQRGGFWRFLEATVTGYPTSASYFGAAVVARAGGAETGSEGGHLVLAARMSGATKTTQKIRLGTRQTIAGAMNWTEIYHSGSVVGTVVDSGGVPDGAIIESGSNANGSYVKYADGTLHAVKTLTGQGPVSTADGSGFVSAGIDIGTLPAVFFAAPSRTFSTHTVSTNAVGMQGISAPGVTSGGFVRLVRNTTYAGTDVVITAIFIGRWKA